MARQRSGSGNEDCVPGRMTDSAAIAQVLLHYAREPQRRLEHGRQARERAEREYSLRRMLADYENLYRRHSGLTLEAA